MDSLNCINDTGGQQAFESTKWFLENLVNEYKGGFESLKAMLPFCRSKLDSQQMDHFDYEFAVIEANIAQVDAQYKNLESIYLESFVRRPTEEHQSNLILNTSNCISTSIEPNYSNQHLEPSVNFNCELPNLEDTSEKLSLDYIFDASDDFFEFIKAENSGNLFNLQTSHSDQENQEQSCLLIPINCDRQTTKPKSAKASTTKLNRSLTNKSNKSSSSSAKKSRPNECRVWYKCAWEGCSFGSYYNGVVKRHSLKRHSGKIRIDKSSNSSMHRFKCDWPGCEVSLVAYHKLVEHKRKHTGEKPFRCKKLTCNYATARLYSMIIHERTHKLDSFSE